MSLTRLSGSSINKDFPAPLLSRPGRGMADVTEIVNSRLSKALQIM